MYQYSIRYSGSGNVSGLPKQIIAQHRAGALRVLARVFTKTPRIPSTISITRVGRFFASSPRVISRF